MISYQYTQSYSPIQDKDVNANNKSIYYPDGLDVYNNHYEPNTQYNKRFIGPTIKCSDDEWEFFLKYGKVDLVGWREHTSQEKEDFKKFLQLYQSFWELYYEYYEDLSLYAIMYRNVKNLIPTMTDVISVRFFVSKANEIKGFKKQLKKDNIIKSRVAWVYFCNKTIFTKVFSKYLDYDNQVKNGYNTLYEMQGMSKNIITGFYDDTIPCSVGINNLTNQDCLEILKHGDELLLEYRYAYEKCLEKYIIEDKGISYSEEFFLSKFIPYYGRISSKTASSYDRVCKAKISPILDKDLRDLTLSNNERLIVRVWCRQIKENHDIMRKEEEEKQKIQDIKHNHINTLTIYNNYKLGSWWKDGYGIKFSFLYLQNLFFNEDIAYLYTPNIAVNQIVNNELYKKQIFEKFLEIKLNELVAPEGIESSFLTGMDYGYGSKNNDYIKGRIIIWDEYGIKFDEKTMSPISPEDIKSFNNKIISHDYNDSEPPCTDEFINYIKKNPNIKLYITKNDNSERQDYIAEIIRIRDNVKIIDKMQSKLHENTSEVKSLSEQELYEYLSTRQPLRGTLYRELCRYIDFNGITITSWSEDGFDESNTLFHRVETEKDKEEGDRKMINNQYVDNYRWYFEIKGGNILKNRIKEVFYEDKINKGRERNRQEEEARRAKFEYNQRNKHYRDSNISFDEATHLYKVDGVILQSVTNFVKGCFPEFDAEFFAKKKAAYLGKTTQEVLDMWEQKGRESRELGTELHKRIENYYQGIISNVDDRTFNLFKMFADKIELKPYRTEWAVYDLKHSIAGTIDFVDYQNGEYIIYDWKRSEKIIDNGMPVKIDKNGEKGNYPLEHLDNTPYYHYALQLSIYKFILENNYNMKISDLRLGIFHPTYNKPYVLRIPYLEKEINDIFGLRSEVLF